MLVRSHFIVSQVNPHVIPFVISDTSNDAFSPIGPALKLVNFLNRQVKSICLGVRGRALLHWNLTSFIFWISISFFGNGVFDNHSLFRVLKKMYLRSWPSSACRSRVWCAT